MAATHCSQLHAVQWRRPPGRHWHRCGEEGPFGISFCQRVEQEGGEEAEDGALQAVQQGRMGRGRSCQPELMLSSRKLQSSQVGMRGGAWQCPAGHRAS